MLNGLSVLAVHYNCLSPTDANIRAILDNKNPGWDTTQTNCLEVPTYSLSLQTTGTGSGTVSGDGDYEADATVTLSAIPAANSDFEGWTPAPCAASFTMPANDLECTAGFTLKTYPVTATAGNGGGIEPASVTVTHGETASFDVAPDSGYRIESVTGCGGTLNGGAYTTAPVTSACTVSAGFSALPPDLYALTLQTAGTGSGTVGGGGDYEAGASVTLSATPGDDSDFTGWSPAPCAENFAMPANNLECAATFILKTYPVTATAGTGCAIAPAAVDVAHGTTADFSVAPDSGYAIESVTGCGGVLNDETYTTGPITGACSVTVTCRQLNTPPQATNVDLGGELKVGQTLSGTYTYSDTDNDAESGSTYRWQRADDNNGGNAVQVATTQTYTPTRAGAYLRFCVTPSDGQDFGTEACSAWRGPMEGQASALIRPEPDALSVSANGPRIDVLVAYTPAAASSVADIDAEIQKAIDKANAAYAGSGIDQRLRLVHKVQVNYTESNFRTDLSRLTSTNDSYLDEVHGLRNTYKADMTALIRKSGEACGIGYLMTSGSVNNPAFEALAFSVTAVNCIDYHSFAHELGHNMGAHHDEYVTNGQHGAFEYSHGYTHIGANAASSWRTIMAYVDKCFDSFWSNCTRKGYFSNPQVAYNGHSTGTADANNALTLNNTAEVVSNFRIGTGGGSSASTLLLELFNDGAAPLEVTDISAGASWVSGITPTSLSIPAGASASVQITVDTAAVPMGETTANLSIQSNAANDNPLLVPVTVTKVPADRPPVVLDSTKVATFDTGSGTLHLSVDLSGLDIAFQTELRPVTHPSKPNSLLFLLEHAEPLGGGISATVPSYDAMNGVVTVPAVNVPDEQGMPQLYEAKLRWLPALSSNGLVFELVEAMPIEVPAVE